MSELSDNLIKLQNNMPLDKEVLEIDCYKIAKLTIDDKPYFVKILKYPRIINNRDAFKFNMSFDAISYEGGSYETLNWQPSLIDMSNSVMSERTTSYKEFGRKFTTMTLQYCIGYDDNTQEFIVDEDNVITLTGAYITDLTLRSHSYLNKMTVEFNIGCTFITYNRKYTPTEEKEQDRPGKKKNKKHVVEDDFNYMLI